MTCYHVIATYLPSVVFINRLDLDRADLSRSVKDLPPSLTVLLECHKPPSKPPNPLHPAFGLFSEEEIPKTLSLDDYTWMLARSLTRKPNHSDVPESQECKVPQSAVPVWSAYNSLVNNTMHVTRVGAPPLIAAPAHEWITLLTVLKQVQAINVKVVGANRNDDLNHIILRPGELHIVMAQLRSIGAFIENSGIDMAWVESELYGPSTVKQIIDGKHVKRGETAHLVTLQALFILYQEAFLQQESEPSRTTCKTVE